ncbi:MAG: hypothetical protein IJU23_00280 [Proteobacteria bacterium]|nr:hypothetical protein [Pseudomonadota bacterium]
MVTKKALHLVSFWEFAGRCMPTRAGQRQWGWGGGQNLTVNNNDLKALNGAAVMIRYSRDTAVRAAKSTLLRS